MRYPTLEALHHINIQATVWGSPDGCQPSNSINLSAFPPVRNPTVTVAAERVPGRS